MKRIAYHSSSQRLADPLCEMGYELFPFSDACAACDAVLYESGALPQPKPQIGATLLVHSGGMNARQVDEILRQRCYAPIVPRG